MDILWSCLRSLADTSTLPSFLGGIEVGRLELGRVMCSGEEFGWVLAERSEWVKGFGFGFW